MALTRWHGTVLSQDCVPPLCYYTLLHLTAMWMGPPNMCGHHWQVWCVYLAGGPMPGHSCSVGPPRWKCTPISRMVFVPSGWTDTWLFMYGRAHRRSHTPISKTVFVQQDGLTHGLPCRCGPTLITQTSVLRYVFAFQGGPCRG